MDAPLSQQRQRRRDPTVFVFLSLYLLLLAFFVLLNAISKKESARAEMAIGSLTSTFRTSVDVSVDQLVASTSAGVFRARAVFFADVKKLFEQTLPIADFEAVQRGTVLRTELSIAEIFRPERAQLHSKSGPLLDGIANSISGGVSGIRYEMELLIGTGPVLPQGAGAHQSMAVRRAGAFARELRARGVPPEAIRVGVMPGDLGQLQLSFYARVEDHAKIAFEELVR